MPWKHGRGFWAWAKLKDGGRKRVPLGTDNRQLALEMEAMLAQLLGRREWALLDAAINGPLSVGELHDHWSVGPEGLADLKARLSDIDLNDHFDGWQTWAGRRASDTTVKRYGVQLRALMLAGAPFPRSQFTRKKINQAFAQLPGSGSTANRYRAAWSSFAKYLIEIEVLEVNPVRSVQAARNNEPRTTYLALADAQRLVDAQPEPYRTIAALREGAGVEIAAALTVRRRDIDESNRTVHVHGTKNTWRDRPVWVEDWAWTYIMAAAKGKLPDAPLFVCADGTPATYYGARVAHLAAMKALNLTSGYRIHDARHSFAVRCMKARIDPQIIANNLGHRDATMVLKVYGKYRVTGEDIRRSHTGTDDR